MSIEEQRNTRIGAYLLGEVIGRGGMGVVYRATHVHLAREVALKLLAPELSGNEEFRRRFLRESRLAASLDHPNVITVYDAGDSDGTLYIAMRYVEGVDLAGLLRNQGPLEPLAALSLLDQVAAALDAAHEHGLIHRDVKPANVMIASGRCYLTDFGLTKQARASAVSAALTRTGSLLGTLNYAAPEQIEGREITASADLYALGCVLHECLTGAPPFTKDSEVALLYAHLSEPPPPPSKLRSDLPPAIDDVVAKALAKSPAERYRTCGEFMAGARAALTPEPGPSLAAQPSAPPTVAAEPPTVAAEPPTAPAEPTDAVEDPWQRVPRSPSRAATRREARSRTWRSPRPVIGPTVPRAGQQADTSTVPVDAAGKPAVLRRPRSRGRFILLAGAAVILAAIVGVVAATGGGSGNHAPSSASVRPLSKGAIPVGNSPNGIVIRQGNVWVANAGDGTITRIDQASGHVLSTTSYTTSPETAAPIATWGQGLWVGDGGNGTVDELDPTNGTTIRKIAVGGQPYALNDVSGSLWILNSNDTVARMASGSTTPSVIHVGSGPKRIGFTNTRLWVDNRNDGTVTRIDPTTGQVLGTIPVGGHPTAMAVVQGSLWVADVKQNTVTRRDIVSLRAIGSRIHVGRGPGRIAVDNGSLWVTNSGDGTVTRIDASTGRVLATTRVGGYPDAIAADNGVVWVALWSRPTVEHHGPPGGVARIDEATGKLIGK